MPANDLEATLIQRNALMVLKEVMKMGNEMGYTAEKIQKAITDFS